MPDEENEGRVIQAVREFAFPQAPMVCFASRFPVGSGLQTVPAFFSSLLEREAQRHLQQAGLIRLRRHQAELGRTERLTGEAELDAVGDVEDLQPELQ